MHPPPSRQQATLSPPREDNHSLRRLTSPPRARCSRHRLYPKPMYTFYVTNSDLYSKGDNGWTLKPGGGQAYVDAFNGVSMVEAGDVVRSNGKVAGVELVGGKPALVYTYDSTVKSLKMTSNFTVWVDQASGLMVKMHTMDAKGSKSVMNITYDPGITITLPAEAKSAKTTN